VILFNLHAAKDSLLKSFAYILRGNLDIHPHAAWGGQSDKDKGWGKGERMTLRSQTFMVQILRCLSSMSLRTTKLGFDPPVFVPSHRFLTQNLYTSLHSKLPWNGWAVHIKKKSPWLLAIFPDSKKGTTQRPITPLPSTIRFRPVNAAICPDLPLESKLQTFVLGMSIFSLKLEVQPFQPII